MLDLDTWQETGEALMGSPLRTLLSMAGVFWGTLLLVAMLGFSRGLEGAAGRAMNGLAVNAVSVWGGVRTVPYQGFREGERLYPDSADLPALRAIPGVKYLAPRNQLGGWRGSNVVRAGAEAGSFSVMGDVPEMAFIENHLLLRGRNLDELDLRELRKVAVIGRQVTQLLFPDGSDPLGRTIEINRVPFQVVGEFKSRRADDEGDRAEQSIKVPFDTFQHTWGQGTTIHWVSVVAHDDVSSELVEERMKGVLRRLHHAAPDDPEAFSSFNSEREFGRVRRIFYGIRGVTWLVGGATLLSGAVGIGNVMLIAVRERTRELGLRRAVGARPIDVVVMILRETLVMTLVSGLSGLVVGSLLCEAAATALGPDNPSFGPPHIDPGAAVIAAVLLVASGVAAGLLPAQRAAAIDPAEALRSE